MDTHSEGHTNEEYIRTVHSKGTYTRRVIYTEGTYKWADAHMKGHIRRDTEGHIHMGDIHYTWGDLHTERKCTRREHIHKGTYIRRVRREYTHGGRHTRREHTQGRDIHTKGFKTKGHMEGGIYTKGHTHGGTQRVSELFLIVKLPFLTPDDNQLQFTPRLGPIPILMRNQ